MKGKESKGKAVKTFTEYVPQPDLTKEQQVVTVYFKAADGDFVIYLDKHVADTVENHPEAPPGRNVMTRVGPAAGGTWQGRVQAKTLEQVIAWFKETLELYSKITKTEQREKVIRVYYKANRRGDGPHKQISFADTPAMSLRFEILWRAGTRLYSEVYGGGMRDVGGAADDGKRNAREGVFLLDWTEEREQFLAKLHGSLTALIERLDLFFGDLSGNMDRVIAAGPGALFLPAAPSVAGEDLTTEEGGERDA